MTAQLTLKYTHRDWVLSAPRISLFPVHGDTPEECFTKLFQRLMSGPNNIVVFTAKADEDWEATWSGNDTIVGRGRFPLDAFHALVLRSIATDLGDHAEDVLKGHK